MPLMNEYVANTFKGTWHEHGAIACTTLLQYDKIRYIRVHLEA